VVKGRADIYLAGHDHDLQHLKPEGNLHFFVAGGGGASARPIKPNARSLFAKQSFGFAVIDADSKRLKISLLGPDLATLYEYTLTREASSATAPSNRQR
jgi:hypothetical protein